jgi:hypothetical protein
MSGVTRFKEYSERAGLAPTKDSEMAPKAFEIAENGLGFWRSMLQGQ